MHEVVQQIHGENAEQIPMVCVHGHTVHVRRSGHEGGDKSHPPDQQEDDSKHQCEVSGYHKGLLLVETATETCLNDG